LHGALTGIWLPTTKTATNMANPHPHPLPPRWKPGQSGNPSGRPKGLAHYIQGKTRKGCELIDWYLAIWRGEKEPLGRVPKPTERFEAAETLLAYGWGRPPQYVDLALASTEVRRIEVTFDTAPLGENGRASSMVVDVTPAPHDSEGAGPSEPAAPPGLPAPRSSDDRAL
jgi:hypothetical protein